MFKTKRFVAVLFLLAALVASSGSPLLGMNAARPTVGTLPVLGAAAFFRVLGGSTVTNTGPTVIDRDLGVFPGSAITGFPPGIVVPPGTVYAGGAVAQQAQSDVTIAYNALAGQACDSNLTGQDLGGLTLTPGVYCFNSSAQLTGELALDLQGDPDAVFVFQIGSTLTTASNASVVFVNGGPNCNVFWQVGSSATFGTGTAFEGTVLALASITLNTGANLNGRALAQTGAVTMDTNNIALVCPAAPLPTNTPVPVQTNTPVPVSTNTPVPAPTNTSVPASPNAPTNTPVPVQTNTPVPVPTNTPVPVMTNTPVPSAVELLYFVSSRSEQTIMLRWATAEEVDNFGFNLYRASVDNFWKADLIHFEPSAIEGGTGAGAIYQYIDTPPAPGSWWYWLVDVDTRGIQASHSPSVVMAMPMNVQLYLPWTEQ